MMWIGEKNVAIPSRPLIGWRKTSFLPKIHILWKCNSQNKMSNQKFTTKKKKCQNIQKNVKAYASSIFENCLFFLLYPFSFSYKSACFVCILIIYISFLFFLLFFPYTFLCLFSLLIFKVKAVILFLLKWLSNTHTHTHTHTHIYIYIYIFCIIVHSLYTSLPLSFNICLNFLLIQANIGLHAPISIFSKSISTE